MCWQIRISLGALQVSADDVNLIEDKLTKCISHIDRFRYRLMNIRMPMDSYKTEHTDDDYKMTNKYTSYDAATHQAHMHLRLRHGHPFLPYGERLKKT